jgi:cytochrome c biogenesis protein CcmG/thiol:disulfide interchange protein DsbE
MDVEQTTPEQPASPRHHTLRNAARLASLALVVALLGLLVWRLVDDTQGAALVEAVRKEEKPAAPGFDLPILWSKGETWPRELRAALGDGRVSLDELDGRPLVVNFWASWCVPCKEEAPRLNAAARRHGGRVAFLGIDVQDFKSDARRFLRRYGVNYVSVRDPGDTTYTAYGLTGLPETYFVDRNGRIAAHVIGAIKTKELDAGLAAIAGGMS